jgi:glycerophosphoryl diester phosphodiesterase/phosphatidylglycerol phospholipase C
MFHDPTLDRTTTGKGLIREQTWKGVIQYVHKKTSYFAARARSRYPMAVLSGHRHVRTTKEPVQPIPLFEELIALLMEVRILAFSFGHGEEQMDAGQQRKQTS